MLLIAPVTEVIVVTGASDGIGAVMARQWAKRRGPGLGLVLAARGVAKLERVAADCRDAGASALVQRCDVTVQADCIALAAAAMKAFGRIDTIVNNAGMSAHARFDAVQDLGWYEDLMRLNLWGSVWCTHAALPHIVATKGRIVAVSSLAGLFGVPGRTAYSATKAAMNGFFDSLRLELADLGVSITIAYPGIVATEIRRRGYGADGRPAGQSGLDERGAMPVEACAKAIVDAADARRREVLMDGRSRVGRWLKLIAPSLVDRMALKALRKDEAPT